MLTLNYDHLLAEAQAWYEYADECAGAYDYSTVVAALNEAHRCEANYALLTTCVLEQDQQGFADSEADLQAIAEFEDDADFVFVTKRRGYGKLHPRQRNPKRTRKFAAERQAKYERLGY